jgi:ATP-dependent 26S proteasome regulatory subunit
MSDLDDETIRVERAQNIWTSFVRKVEPMARAAQITAQPKLDFEHIGGLTGPKDEILTYACAITNPEVYSNWGTFPPSGVLLIGAPGVGKSLLAEALATRTRTSFVRVDVPRMVLDIVHGSNKVGELIQGWTQVLEEMPPITVFFDELEFSQAHDLGGRRPDLPIGPIMDFLLELIDRTIATGLHLVVGATGYPDTLRPAFVRPGRFERVVEVAPVFPDDIIEALVIHASQAEERAGRPLFDDIDWKHVVDRSRDAATGDWVHVLHAVLRRKARCDTTGDMSSTVKTADLDREVARFTQAQKRINLVDGGNYL